jgi:putative endonuclease
MTQPSDAIKPASRRRKDRDYWIGQWGELARQQWLESRGWRTLAHRWRSRWGEVDLIATQTRQLAFIEVKTRQTHNWDANGLLAMTPRKQAKLWRTAESFLAHFPDYATWPCRFDLALVSYPYHLQVEVAPDAATPAVAQSLIAQFVVRDYLENILCGN